MLVIAAASVHAASRRVLGSIGERRTSVRAAASVVAFIALVSVFGRVFGSMTWAMAATAAMAALIAKLHAPAGETQAEPRPHVAAVGLAALLLGLVAHAAWTGLF